MTRRTLARSAVILVGMAASAWCGWTGRGGLPLFGALMIAVLGSLGAVAIFLLAMPVIERGDRGELRRVVRWALVALAVSGSALALHAGFDHASLQTSFERGDALAEAIDRFERERGRAPASLAEIERTLGLSLSPPTRADTFRWERTSKGWEVSFPFRSGVVSGWVRDAEGRWRADYD